jgi:hypothetical protein
VATKKQQARAAAAGNATPAKDTKKKPKKQSRGK